MDRFSTELIERHRSTFVMAFGLRETFEWSLEDSLGNYTESLASGDFRYTWISDPSSLALAPTPQDVVYGYEPFLMKANGRPHRDSSFMKLSLDGASHHVKETKKEKFAFPLGRFSEVCWHVSLGLELRRASLLVGKKSAKTIEGLDAVGGYVGVVIAQLDGGNRVVSFPHQQLVRAEKAAKKALGGKSPELRLVID